MDNQEAHGGLSVLAMPGDLAVLCGPVGKRQVYSVNKWFQLEGKWHHISVICSGGQLEAYIDGVQAFAVNPETGWE